MTKPSSSLAKQKKVFLVFAVLALWLVSFYAAYQLPSVRRAVDAQFDKFDDRPPLTILFIGNSRTFYHDMPYMVRRIADSANVPQKYSITMQAPGGVRLEDHWKDPKTQELLKQKWDYVVLQARSNEQQNQDTDASFFNYGSNLINVIKMGGAKPVIFVTWNYDSNFELFQKYPQLQYTLQGSIQSSHAQLAQSTGAELVNVGAAWEMLRTYRPNFQLYEDGNHPTVHGSYLAALMFYKYFAKEKDLSKVTYIPSGITAEEAKLIKEVAARSY